MIGRRLDRLGLRMEPEKTEFMVFPPKNKRG